MKRSLQLASLSLALMTGIAFADDKKKPLSESDVGVRRQSPEALARLVEAGKETDFLIARRELRRWGKKAGPALASLILSESPRARRCALNLLTEIKGCPEAEEPLLKLFQSETAKGYNQRAHFQIRRQAASLLGLMSSQKALPVLFEALANHPWLKIREGARLALGLYDKTAVDMLVAEYDKARKAGKDGIMVRIMLVLGDVGGDKARKLLLDNLKTTKGPYAVTLRHHAAIGLESLKDRNTVEALITQLGKEDDHYVQKYITRSLCRLTGQNYPPDVSRWETWWRSNKEEFLGKKEDPFKDLELPPIKIPKPKKRP